MTPEGTFARGGIVPGTRDDKVPAFLDTGYVIVLPSRKGTDTFPANPDERDASPDPDAPIEGEDDGSSYR